MKTKMKAICLVLIACLLLSALASSSFLVTAEDLPAGEEETAIVSDEESVEEESVEEAPEEEREGAVPKEWFEDESHRCMEIADILEELYFSEGTIDRSTIKTPERTFEEQLHYSWSGPDDLDPLKALWTILPLDFWESDPDALSWVTIFVEITSPYTDIFTERLKRISDFAKENGRPFMEPEYKKGESWDDFAGDIFIRTVLSYNEMVELFEQGYGLWYIGDYGPGYPKLVDYYFIYM